MKRHRGRAEGRGTGLGTPCQGDAARPDMSGIPPEGPGSDPEDRSVAADILLRQEPDGEEEEEEDEEDDDGKEDDDDDDSADDGYSERPCGDGSPMSSLASRVQHPRPTASHMVEGRKSLVRLDFHGNQERSGH